MAEFELQMTCTNTQTKAWLRLLALLFPLWGVTLPTLLVMFIVILLRLPSDFPLGLSLLFIGALAGTTAVCLIAALVCDDHLIRASKEGLSFPLKFSKSLKFRNQRDWKDLARLRLLWNRSEKFGTDEALVLIFSSGGSARLPLKDLKADELEQFLIVLEAYARTCERDADLEDLQQAIKTKSTGLSSTELWQRSLSAKFSNTTFAPLEPEHRLQDGRIRILKQLSFGGSTAMYLAICEGISTPVALKEAAFSDSPEEPDGARELFSKEAVLLSVIDHRNITRIHDYFVENGRHYLLMDHAEGIDLYRFILAHGPQPWSTVKQWAGQIVEAAHYLHSLMPALVHGEICPENLILKHDGTIVLTNLSASPRTEGAAIFVTGKTSYLSPEQLKGEPSPKSDVYSIGATIYYLLCGQEPEPLTPALLKTETALSAVQTLLSSCTSQDEASRPDSTELIAILGSLNDAENPRESATEITEQNRKSFKSASGFLPL